MTADAVVVELLAEVDQGLPSLGVLGGLPEGRRLVVAIGASVAPDVAGLATLRRLMAGGLTHVYMGVESGDLEGLVNMNKKIKPETHLRAARLLTEQGAGAESIAVHLLATVPGGEPWVASTLRAAASTALGRGAPETAARYLRRALDEPLGSPARARLHLDLGTAEWLVGKQPRVLGFDFARPANPPERREPAPSASLTPLPAAERGAASTGDWAGFVAFVGREQKFLASHLQSANATGLPPGPLRIDVGERHHLVYLQDGENLALLKDLARRFFSREVAIEIHWEEGDGARPSAETGAGRPANAIEERSEMVKEALRIFGGSVRQVRRDNS